MKVTATRRRFLTIAAAAVALPSVTGAAPTLHWRGRAMGAEAQILFDGISSARANRLLSEIREEVSRLEQIFNLYRPGSEIAQLNSDGELQAPSPDFLTVLSFCRTVHEATGGRFDPTVQAYWAAAEVGSDLTLANASVGFEEVGYDASSIRLSRPGMALTLNGVVQGYVTDRVARILREAGLANVLIDMGEIAASGCDTGGALWSVPVVLPEGRRVKTLRLDDRALATSAPGGAYLPGHPDRGHILDTGRIDRAPRWRLVSISARNAATADALSTAACLMDRPAIEQALRVFPEARAEILDPYPTNEGDTG